MAFDFTTSTEEAETGASLEIPVSMASSKPVRATQKDPVLKTKLGKEKKKSGLSHEDTRQFSAHRIVTTGIKLSYENFLALPSIASNYCLLQIRSGRETAVSVLSF